MRRLLVVGYGDIAEKTCALLKGRYRIYALTRGAEKAAMLRSRGIVPIRGDLDFPETLRRLAGLAQAVLHFAPPGSDSHDDRRTARLLAALANRGSLPQRLIYISTTGVYGDCSGDLVVETRPARPLNDRASRRLDAEQRLRSWATRNWVALTILRVPGIYGRSRLPLERLRKGTPVLQASEDVYTNHIHNTDLARICVRALERGKPNRIYNACDDSQLKMADYFDLVADTFGLPRPRRITRVTAQAQLPKELLSFMSESRRVSNARMKRELGVRLRYPTVADALAARAEIELPTQ